MCWLRLLEIALIHFTAFGGAHPLVMDALAEMSEAQMQMRLTHPPFRAQARSRGRRGMRAGLP